ncbi:hypothetical protein UAB1_gp192 [Salmonella phage UAB_1]|uniref:Uncharacterized protein n=1 Tax=Escherichia phage muut TaxID=2696426 RepID=A0A6B9WPF5_9CAUD|nr:hypothetical protein JR322_gp064 [Escherichia phage muut]QHR75423.1 hypothetical protein outra_102 [Escherichia phage outra]UIS31552.1 hypothetical protein UAB1_gp192 [Salmonella phage UAB_1]UPW37434.1 hypothetical protein ESCO8_00205 [Escherichia phage vB_EcoM_ESCO8]UPW38636.1 hypothetical protein ESCO32_00203 [Escherichia phage vB_EcoM_ESCO32]QHR65981.1 hypothetical protein muut_184 [Escherichia phage muut]
MRKVNVEVLEKFRNTRDCTIGKVYEAILLEDGDQVPAPYHAFNGQISKVEGGLAICFIDDVGDAVAFPVINKEDKLKITELN